MFDVLSHIWEIVFSINVAIVRARRLYRFKCSVAAKTSVEWLTHLQVISVSNGMGKGEVPQQAMTFLALHIDNEKIRIKLQIEKINTHNH